MNKNKKNKIVAIALSGGVDSAMAAYLLKKQGYNLVGLHMKLFNCDESCYEESSFAARQICKQLDIKYYPINLTGQFKKIVIDYYINEYKKGRTPNPCVVCNKYFKFGELWRVAKELGADYLATGHYIRLQRKLQNIKLLKPKDKEKDQTYFLYNLTQKQLAHILFPLGNYRKTEVRKMAVRVKLPHLKKESQDVCFLNRNGQIFEHKEFLQGKLKLKSGPIKNLAGKIIGKHQGLPLYTIGQRRGVEIGGTGPYYVARTDFKTNTLYVANNFDDPAIYSEYLIATKINWIAGFAPSSPFKCEAVIRYRHKPVACIIIKQPSNYLIKFAIPQRAVTPGQSVVFYKKNELLGGGVITIKN